MFTQKAGGGGREGGPFGLEVNLLNGRPTKLDCWLRERGEGGGAYMGASSTSLFFNDIGYFLVFLLCFRLCVCVFQSHGGPKCEIFAIYLLF